MKTSWLIDVEPSIWFTWGNVCICLAWRSSGVVARIGKLLAPRASSMVFGRNNSAEKGGAFFMKSLG
jgi:predicted outer membrane repeat protein